jgi:hypothetical protein
MTHEEHAAILAGLRMLQHTMEHWPSDAADYDDILTDCGTVTPLTFGQIDELAEKINTEPMDKW